MKHTTKRLLLLAMALVLVASLLPGIAAKADARTVDENETVVSAPVLSNYTYTGSKITPSIPASELYTVKENAGGTDAGTYKVVLSLTKPEDCVWDTSNSSEDLTLEYQIEKKELENSMVTGGTSGEYTGEEHNPQPVLTYNGKQLVAEVDYVVSGWADRLLEPGDTASTTITGSGNFEGTISVSYSVTFIDLSKATVAPMSGVYNGEVHTPEVKLSYNGKTLTDGADYIVSSWSGGLKNPGTYTAMANGEGVYNSAVKLEYVISPAALTNVSVSQTDTLTYDGSEKTPAVSATATTVDDSPVKFSYSTSQGGPFGEMPKFTEPGTYTVYYLATADNHSDATGSFPVTINKIAVEAPTVASKVYTGNTLKADIADTERYTVTTNEGGIKAGNYDVVLTLKDADHYTWAGSSEAALTLSFEITQGTNAWVTVPAIADWTYGGTPSTLNGEAKYGTIVVTYTGTTNAGADYDSAEVPTEAGQYTAVCIVEETESYTALEASAPFTVKRADLTAADFTYTEPTLTYNGEDQHTAIKISSDKLPADTAKFIQFYAAGTSDQKMPKDVGNYTFNIYFAESPNYNAVSRDSALSDPSWKFTIKKATNEWTTEPSIENWTYGEASSTPAGKAAFGDYTVTYTGKTNAGVDYSGSAAPTDAGDYKATFTVEGTSNYTGLEKEVSFTVERADLTAADFTYAEPDLTYNGEDQHTAIKISSDKLPADTAKFIQFYAAGTSDQKMPKDAGNYTFSIYFAESPNYNAVSRDSALSDPSWKFTIKKATNEWTTEPSIENWTYGEAPSTPVAEAKSGGTVTVTYTGKTNAGVDYSGSAAPTEAGDYKAIFTAEETGNYGALEQEVSFTVERADLTAADFTYAEPDLTYNGEDQHTAIKITSEKLPAGTLKFIQFFNAKTGNQQMPINAGDYTFRVYCGQSDNYNAVSRDDALSDPSWKFTIKKATPTITWDETEFTYDKMPHGFATIELVDGSDYSAPVTYSYTKQGSSNTGRLPVDAGTYTVTVTTTELSNFEAATASATIIINPKPITPTVTIDGYTYTYSGLARRPSAMVYDGTDILKESDFQVGYENNVEPGEAAVVINPRAGGNYTFDTVRVYFLIMPDTSALEGITPENVTSAYQEIIDEIQEQMDGKDLSNLTEEQQNQWEDLEEYLKELEEAIAKIREQMEQIIEETAELPDHPTGDDLDKINELLDIYDNIEDQLTDEEKTDLADEIEKLETEKEHIEKTNEAVEDALNDTEELLDKDLTHKDEDDVDELIDRIEELLEDPHLTEQQEKDLQDALDKLKDIKEDYDAAGKVEDMIDELPKTGKPDDEDLRDEYQAAKDAYDKLPNKDLVNPKAVAKLEKLAKALRNYKIIKGNAQRWYKNDEELVDLTFTANGPYSKFAYIKIDGEILDSKYYTSKEGSTIVTLKADYLKNLGYAKHTIAIGYEDGDLSGEATGYFRVTLHTDSPATGDTTNIMLFGLLALSSMLGIAALVTARKKRGA